MKKMRKIVRRVIVKMAKSSACVEANTACPFLNFQSKEPTDVKKLRKF